MTRHRTLIPPTIPFPDCVSGQVVDSTASGSKSQAGCPSTIHYEASKARLDPAACGRLGGRPRVPIDADAVLRLRSQGLSWKEVASQLRVGVGTARRAVGMEKIGSGSANVPKPAPTQRGGVL